MKQLPLNDYCYKLNSVLPDDIRVLNYAVVSDDFSARFSCKFREYKYFFFKEDLNIDLVKEAASKLVGQHDFVNFCKKERRDTKSAIERKRNLKEMEEEEELQNF
jgi:tRNA pseudouridine38/39 synthase